MEILTFDAIKNCKPIGLQMFDSPLWGGSFQFRHASVGDKIDARNTAMALAELMSTKNITLELVEAGVVVACSENPKLNVAQIFEMMNQPGGAAEISALADQILKRVTGKNPTT